MFYHISIQLINIYIFINSYSYSFSMSWIVSSDSTTLYLMCFLTIKSTCLLSTCPKRLSWVSTIFSTMGATPTLTLSLSLSDDVIYNPITSSFTTHQRNILISVILNLFSCWFFTSYNPTLYLIQHRLSFSLSGTFITHKINTWGHLHLNHQLEFDI